MKYNDNNLKNTGIPLPIVTFNRAVLFLGILIAILSQQIWVTTMLLAILLPAVFLGKKYSLIFQIGSILFKNTIKTADYEDASLQRFNNSIAMTLLGFAQIAFLFNQNITGWLFAGMVMLASGIAMAGFCLGCYLYYQFKMQKYRFFRSN